MQKNTLKQELLIKHLFGNQKLFFYGIAAKKNIKKKLFGNVYIQEWAFRWWVLKMTTLLYFILAYLILLFFNQYLQVITLKWHQGGELMTQFVL